MKKSLGVMIVEDLYGQIQLAIEFFIQTIHYDRADVLMSHLVDKRMLETPPVRSLFATKPTFLLSSELEPAQVDSLYSEFVPRG